MDEKTLPPDTLRRSRLFFFSYLIEYIILLVTTEFIEKEKKSYINVILYTS